MNEITQFHKKVSLLSVLIAIFIACYYWLLRLGFENNSLEDIFKVLALSFTLQIFPDFISFFKKKQLKNKWNQTRAWYLLLCLTGLTILGALSLYFTIDFSFLLIIVGTGLLGWFVISFFRIKIKNKGIFVIIFALFAFFIPFFVYKTIFIDPLFIEKIIIGTAYVDTTFHAAISNMIKNYNYPTIGIDGLTYLPYHWGSHGIFAFLSALINIPVIKFYNLAYPIVFVPFLFNSFFCFFEALRKKNNIPLHTKIYPFIILFIVIIDIHPNIELNQSYLMTAIIIHSESYSLGLALSFIVLSLLTNYFSHFVKKNTKNNFVFLGIVLPLIITLISIIKISSGFLILGILGYLFLRLFNIKKIASFFYLLVYLFIWLTIFWQTRDNSFGGNFELWSFLKNNHIDNHFYFLVFYYLYALLFIFLFFLSKKIKNISLLKKSFKQKALIEVEVLIFIAFLGFLPGNIIDTGGRNGLYFMDMQRWMAVLMLMAFFPQWIERLKKNNCTLKKIKIIAVIPLIYISFLILINVPRNYYLHLRQVWGHNINTRILLINNAGDSATFSSLKSFYPNFWKKIKQAQQAKEKLLKNQLIQELQKLEKLSRSEKKISCIYIPKSNDIYWNISYQISVPFIAPALSGLVMIEGFPGKRFRNYGYGFSTVGKKKISQKKISDAEISRIAKEQGFKQIFIITADTSNIYVKKIHVKDYSF